jgi:subtilisin family serine protease
LTRKHPGVITLLLLFAILVAAIVTPSQQLRASDWQAEVDPWVLRTAGTNGETEFIILLSEQAELGMATTLNTKLEKGSFVYGVLTETAERTQPPVIAALNSMGVEYRAYWVANMIWVRGDIMVIEAMARRPDIAHIYANPAVKLDSPDRSHLPDEGLTSIEWNILKVNADDVWALGFTGQGTVIGGQDTGYDWDHPALINQYRGWDGNDADHNYNWHDSIHENNPNTPPGNPCGFDSAIPCDDHGHGTHTMGTMVGDDGGSNQIGMAPGAEWISCRNMEDGWGTPVTYAECYQWFIAPTDVNDENPDPTKAPHAINNSWSCPPAEG